MFKEAIEVKAKSVDSKRLYKDVNSDLAAELHSLHKDLLRKVGNVSSKLKDTAFIARGTGSNIHNKGEMHRRSQFDETEQGILVAKGSGLNNWQEVFEEVRGVGFEFYTNDNKRRFPITRKLMRTDNHFETHKYLGGMSLEYATHEFVNGLRIIHSCKLAGVEEPKTFPIAVNKPVELPVLEGGEIRLVDKEKYCDGSFKNGSEGRVLNSGEFSDLAILYYVGINPIDRISEWEGGNIIHPERLPTARRFAETFASQIAAVHLQSGTFSNIYRTRQGKENGSTSCLTTQNTSIVPEILDWDDIYFHSFGKSEDEHAFRESVEMDMVYAIGTLVNYCNTIDREPGKGIFWAQKKVVKTEKETYDIHLSADHNKRDAANVGINVFTRTYDEVMRRNGRDPIGTSLIGIIDST